MKVSLFGSLRAAANDAETLDLEAQTIRELLKKLVDQYPAMHQHVERGIAVSVDGVMYRDDRDVSIPTGVEVVLLPRIQGG